MTERPAGLCLAAGASSRMGEPKALLFFPDGIALFRAVRSLLDGGCGEVVVVLGAEAETVAPFVPEHPDVRVVVNADWTSGRTGSIQCGIEAVDAPAYVLLPVDHPLVEPLDVFRLVSRAGDAPVVRTTFEGRGGHPVLFSQAVAREVRALGPDAPLRGVLRRHRENEIRVEASPGVRFDMNTPADYQEALRRWAAGPPEGT